MKFVPPGADARTMAERGNISGLKERREKAEYIKRHDAVHSGRIKPSCTDLRSVQEHLF